MAQTQWIAELTQQNLPSINAYQWLTKPYILSKALKRVSQSLTVNVLNQQFDAAIDDEYSILKMSANELPFVRQVFLIGDNEVPLTYGRVIIPRATYDAHFPDFEKLGGKLIGETLLYNNPDVERDNFEYACLSADDARCAFVYQHLPQLPLDPLWARRSVFHMKGMPLLVTELFLPFLPAYIPGNDNAI